MNNKTDFFRQQLHIYDKQVEDLKSRFNAFSLYRIFTFVMFLTAAILSINFGHPLLLLLISTLFVIVFGYLVNRHNQIAKKRKIYQLLALINNEEIKRLEHNFSGIYDGGEFADEHHPYAVDLDIFGKGSLYQLINRAGTINGKYLLKSWLEQAAPKEIVELRQKAIAELTPSIQFRQRLQAYGMNSKSSKEEEQGLYHWLKGEDLIRNSFLFRIIPYVVIAFSLTLIGVVVFGNLPFTFLLLPFIITGLFLYRIIDYSRATYDLTLSGVTLLQSVENIILLIESQQFEDSLLVNLQARLLPQQTAASQKIHDLRKIFEWLSLRRNQIYQILNSVFLLDFILLAMAEKWRANHKDEIEGWFDAIAHFEALSSIAAFAFANESHTFPKIIDDDFVFRAMDIGHPLMPDAQRINNDFVLEGRGKSCIITGSNMAGKSTFLRTIGTNAVLAFCGAPVCALKLELSKFQVYTSMRTKDNLEENISSFYAELVRLKLLLETIDEGQPVLFLLDEILKGTNSVDRHKGAESLIIQLNKLNAFGLVSTHDLELGRLSDKNGQLTNYNFSSRIEEEEIIFDYKLRPGICESTNASQLMAKMGIEIM